MLSHRPRGARRGLPLDGEGHRRARRDPPCRGLAGRRARRGHAHGRGGATDRADPHLGMRRGDHVPHRPSALPAPRVHAARPSGNAVPPDEGPLRRRRPLQDVTGHPRRRVDRRRAAPRGRRGRRPAQRGRQNQGRRAPARDPDGGPHLAVYRAHLLRDAPESRTDGRPPGRLADVADRDGGGAGRAAQHHRVRLRADRQPESLRRARARAERWGRRCSA